LGLSGTFGKVRVGDNWPTPTTIIYSDPRITAALGRHHPIIEVSGVANQPKMVKIGLTVILKINQPLVHIVGYIIQYGLTPAV